MAQPTVALPLLVVTSTIVRTLLAWSHSTPRYFPDEYIYAALGRSIGHGNLEIRGVTAHFPALLEPVLAAPIWRLFEAGAAYHLVQAENALCVSLAAVPVFYLARRLALGSGFALLCSVYALLVPSLVLVAFILSDPVGYLFALAAISTGVGAVDRPSARAQFAFVFLATCAALTRVEYFALFPSFLIAALAVDRWRTFRTQRIALILIGVPGVGAIVVALGYYSAGLRSLRFDAGFGRWALLYLFLLTVESGVVMVPGAIAGLLQPRRRAEAGFAWLAGSLALLLLLESTTPATDPSRFKERYLFVLLPLVPIAFGLYLKNGRPLRSVVWALAAVIAVAAARLPLSQYAASTFKTDSQFLFAVSYAESRVGVGTASLIVAGIATLGVAIAAFLAVVDIGRLVLVWAITIALATTAAAVALDLQLTRGVRASLARNLTWVDHSARGNVTAIAARPEASTPLQEALFWNSSIQRERVVSGSAPTDSFSAPALAIPPDGRLDGVSGEFLIDDFDTTASFSNAQQVASEPHLTLWRPVGKPQLRLFIEGRFEDGWLTAAGRIRAWPLSTQVGTSIGFVLSLPRHWRTAVYLRLGRSRFLVRPGHRQRLICRSTSGPLDVPFSSIDRVLAKDLRVFTVRMSDVRVRDTTPGQHLAAHVPVCEIAS